MTMMGWGCVPNAKTSFRAEMIPRKHHFWSFLAITIPVFQIQMVLPHQNEHDGMGICAKHKKIFSERKCFLENTIFGRFWL